MKIELKSISMHKFLNYKGSEVETIEFPAKSITGILGRNGAGKSTIFDALLFCLFGKDTKGQQNSCLARGGFAEVVFESDSHVVIFQRAMNEKGAIVKSIKVDDAQKKIVQDKEYNRVVRQYIGLDHLAFINSAFITQDHLQDLGSTQPAKRLGIFKRIFSLAIYDKFKDETASEMNALEKKLLPLLRDQETISKRIADLDSVHVEPEEKIKASINVFTHEKTGKEEELASLKESIATLDENIAALNKDIGTIKTLESQVAIAKKELKRNEESCAKKTEVESMLQQFEEAKQSMLAGKSMDEIDARLSELQQSRIEVEGIKQTIISINKSIDVVYGDIDNKTKLFDSHIFVLRDKISEIENNGIVPFDEGKNATRQYGFLTGQISILEEQEIEEPRRTSLHERAAQEKPVMDAFNHESSNLTMLSQELAAKQSEKDTELKQLYERINAMIDEARMAQERFDAMDEISINMEIASLGDKLKTARELEKKIAESRQSLASIKIIEAQVESSRGHLSELQEHLKDLGSVQDAYSKVMLAKSKEQAKLESLNNYMQSLQGKIQDLQTKLSFIKINNKTKLEQDLASTEMGIHDLEERKRILGLLDDAFSQKGIVNECLAKVMPFISAQASQHAITLSDGRITSVRLFKTAKGVDVEISSDAKKRTMQELSGGEKVVVNIAIRFAICQVLSQMTQVKVETVFLDEGDMGSLDQPESDEEDSALDRFMNRLHVMNTYFSNIIVISHIPRVRKYFDVKYNISRSLKGFSKIQKMK